jgi:3-isopropylmalate/(R)-2-methylmalate dehydratase large subunit
MHMGMTLTEKILAQASGKGSCRPEEIIEANIDVVMLHDIGTPGIQEPLKELEVEKIPSSVEVVIIPDHFVPAPTVKAAENLKLTREFAKKHHIKSYYELGRGGICHQVMAEKGHIRPGQVIIGPDSHTTTYGAFGAFATGMGVTDTAIGLGLGKLWFKVPPTVKIILKGRINSAISAKDISLFLLKNLNSEEVLNKALEPGGEIIDQMSVDGRMCLCDMAAEMGAKNCIIPPDKITLDYLRGRVKDPIPTLSSDPGANYEYTYEFDVSDLEPLVACPPSPANVKSVKEVEGIKIDQAFLGSCTNGRMEDLRIAAQLLKNEKVHPDVRLIITPASQEIYLQALKEGLLEIFVQAGGNITSPTCGVCFGGHSGLLAPGERCLSSSNRNFIGRMGSPKAEVYLASPATVVVSAIEGKISDPRDRLGKGGIR